MSDLFFLFGDDGGGGSTTLPPGGRLVLAVRVVRVGECGEEMGVIVTREHLNSSQDKKIKKCSDACDVGFLFK